jgi:hypothetical protein
MAQDLLLAYCVALDAGDFDRLGDVLEQAQSVPGLAEAIEGIHTRFDTSESWTAQLQTYRQQMQEKASNHHGNATI